MNKDEPSLVADQRHISVANVIPEKCLETVDLEIDVNASLAASPVVQSTNQFPSIVMHINPAQLLPEPGIIAPDDSNKHESPIASTPSCPTDPPKLDGMEKTKDIEREGSVELFVEESSSSSPKKDSSSKPLSVQNQEKESAQKPRGPPPKKFMKHPRIKANPTPTKGVPESVNAPMTVNQTPKQFNSIDPPSSCQVVDEVITQPIAKKLGPISEEDIVNVPVAGELNSKKAQDEKQHCHDLVSGMTILNMHEDEKNYESETCGELNMTHAVSK